MIFISHNPIVDTTTDNSDFPINTAMPTEMFTIDCFHVKPSKKPCVASKIPIIELKDTISTSSVWLPK